MRRLRAWLVRLLEMIRRDRGDQDLAAEIEAHLQLHIDDHISAGMSAGEARRAALLKFGPIEAIRGAHRDRRRLPIVDALARDVRFALRTVARQPLFAFTAILTLALGIAANAAVFSIVDAVLLRPLPYADPDRLVRVDPPGQTFIQLGQQGFTLRATIAERVALSASALHSAGALNVGGDPAVRIRGAAITGNFFDVLGVAPAIGRAFTQNDIAARERLVVIGDRFWAERFDRSPDAIGRSIVLDGQPFSIVGVMPPGVDYPDASQLWVPSNGGTQIAGPIPLPTLITRLAAGVSLAQARDEFVRLSGLKGQSAAAIEVTGLRDTLVAGVRPVAVAVWIAAGLVLLVASINVANLLLARVAVRQREFSLRRALGASPAHLVRQVLIEGAVLSALAAALAIPVAIWTIHAALAFLPATIHGAAGVTLDGRALLVTLGLAVATTVAFGAAPALSVRARGAADILRALPATTVPPFWRRFRSVLLVAECALAVCHRRGRGDAGPNRGRRHGHRARCHGRACDRDRAEHTPCDLPERGSSACTARRSPGNAGGDPRSRGRRADQHAAWPRACRAAGAGHRHPRRSGAPARAAEDGAPTDGFTRVLRGGRYPAPYRTDLPGGGRPGRSAGHARERALRP